MCQILFFTSSLFLSIGATIVIVEVKMIGVKPLILTNKCQVSLRYSEDKYPQNHLMSSKEVLKMMSP